MKNNGEHNLINLRLDLIGPLHDHATAFLGPSLQHSLGLYQ